MNGLSILQCLVATLAVPFLTIEAIISNEYNDSYKNPPTCYDSKAFYGQLPLSPSLVPFAPNPSFPTPQSPGSLASGNTPSSSYLQMPYNTWPVFSIEPASSAPFPSPYSVADAQSPSPCPAPISSRLPSCLSPSLLQPSISPLSIPPPSIPHPSIRQPSITRPSIPRPSIPQSSLLQPSFSPPSFASSSISPSVMELLLKYISMIPPQSGSLTPSNNAPRPFLPSFNVPPPFPKLIPISFKPVQLPRPPTLSNAALSPGQWQSRSLLSPLNTNTLFSSLKHGDFPSPYENY